MHLLLSAPLSSVLLASGSIIDLDITIVVQLALFAIAYFFLKRVLFAPMVKLFEAREAAIEGARTSARETEREAEKRAKEFEQELRKVRVAAGEERERLRQEGLHLERTMLERVRSDVQATLKQADENLTKEGARVRAEFNATVPVMARQIASKLLGREVS